MNDNLRIFIQIMDHLEWLTTRDEYGSSRSKGISTREELASELNEVGIVPKRGYWTPHSLDCFLSRLQKLHGQKYLRAQCDIRFVNTQYWEFASGTHHTEVMQSRSGLRYWNPGKITECEAPKRRNFRTTYDDLWKAHEAREVELDHMKKKCLAKNILRRNRAYVA